MIAILILEINIREMILRELTLEHFDDSVIEKCTEVQEGYFRFIKDFPVDYYAEESKTRLIQKIRYEINQVVFEFVMINTSFLSNISEVQGSLIFPHYYLRG